MERKISEDSIEQKIDLKELLGRDPRPIEIMEFKEEALETIIKRTQDGKDINRENFPNYTKEYASEKGVGISDVDLTDMGDMLLGIDGDYDGSSFVLKMDRGQTGKAHGNITGSYGKPSPDPKKARDFFGLSSKEAREIANRVKEDDDTPAVALGALFQQERELDIDTILRNIGLFVDEN